MSELREKIANIFSMIRYTTIERAGGTIGASCDYNNADQILTLISSELEKLKVMKFTQEQILGLIPAQAILDYDRAKEVLDGVAKAQFDTLITRIKELLG